MKINQGFLLLKNKIQTLRYRSGRSAIDFFGFSTPEKFFTDVHRGRLGAIYCAPTGRKRAEIYGNLHESEGR